MSKRHFKWRWKERVWELVRDPIYGNTGYWYFWSPAHAKQYPERGPHKAWVSGAGITPADCPWLFE